MNKPLRRIGNNLKSFVRRDLLTMQRKEKIQKIRVLFDVQQRLPIVRIFEYSLDFIVELGFKLEKFHGICRACGYFGHGGVASDRGLMPPSTE